MDFAEPLTPIFYIGHHESKRQLLITGEVLRHANDCSYDMLTSPITTPHFQSSVLSRLSAYLSSLEDEAQRNEVPTPLIPALTPLDTPLSPDTHTSQLIAVTSPWIDLASPDPIIADISRQVLHLEIAYAAFCGISSVIIRGPILHHAKRNQAGVTQYARAVLEALSTGTYLQLQILFPMSDGLENPSDEDMGSLAPFARMEYLSGEPLSLAKDELGTWDAWHVIRSMCKYSGRLSVGLTVPPQLPPTSVLDRWYSEPLRLLKLPKETFIPNAKGYPVLSKSHQALIHRYMRLRVPPWLLLSDIGPIPGLYDDSIIMDALAEPVLSTSALASPTGSSMSLASAPTPAEAAQLEKRPGVEKDPLSHLKYLRHLQNTQPPRDQIENFATGYQDYLQNPLQPLADNLESITYEVFEKDPVKYDWYERATAAALTDWVSSGKLGSGRDGKVVVAVAGAGRGPLMTKALKASESTGVAVEAWVVEKNPNAYVLLQRRNAEIWNGRVTVVKSDMRAWKGPVYEDGTVGQVDILISELLGSFADNELSPECLDGVQHVLSPQGISIPASYTAHITPIATPKLFADIQARFPTDPDAFGTPFVVLLDAFDFLSVKTEQFSTAVAVNGKSQHPEKSKPDIQQTWEFSHPISSQIIQQSNIRRGGSAAGGGGGTSGGEGANEHNNRFWRGTFSIANRGVCHGLAGYFETVLYTSLSGERVELSTNPLTMDRKSKDMISWFPIFFPLKQPIYLPDESEVDISMWRMTDDRKVWYEWVVEAWIVLGGERLRLGMSELMSSRNGGCLM